MSTKYYVYAYLWWRRGNDSKNAGFGTHKGSVADLYLKASRQPEVWCITSVSEITEEEYQRLDGQF